MGTHDHLAEIRARRALRESGLPHTGPLQRADSTRNEVFISDGHVVRFNQQASRRLAREADLCTVLAHHPWAPTIEARGGRLGSDYLIVARRPGSSLSRCWPQMTDGDRRSAMVQLGEHLKELHQVPNCGAAEPPASPPHLLTGETPVSGLRADIDRLATVPGVDHILIDEILDLVSACDGAIDDYEESTIIHGDLTLENVLWDGSRVTAIVDFEWSRGAPSDLDLDVLGRYFSIPHVHVPAEAGRWQHTADYREAPQWLAEAYPELFSHPRLADRLMLYALSFEIRGVLEGPPPAADRHRDELNPYGRLVHLVATGGHVSELLDNLGFVSL